MDFLANENFPLVSVKLLMNAGYNVASVIKDTPGANDHDILKRAHNAFFGLKFSLRNSDILDEEEPGEII